MLDKVCVVTPNRRAGLFLKKYMSQRISQAMWAPDVLSMEDFVGQITGITIQEPIALLLDFYRVYVRIEKQGAEPLEEFLKWAPMLLRDFNDIDAYLSEPQHLFDNVLDVKKVESWNPDGSPLTDFQKKYLTFFERFKNYHKEFRKDLLKRQTAYQGLAYRVATEKMESETLPSNWAKVFFVGFNALNQAEETIIKQWTKKGIAEVLWDADKYYLNNPNHEAGLFLRKYKNHWNLPAFDFVGDHFSSGSKKIAVYGVAKNVNQAKLAASILKSLPDESFEEHQTALVLANEELLLPVLNSIPENVDRLNVTMGFPLRKTNTYGLFDAVFQLHITTHRMKSAAPGLNSAFYYKDVIRFFRHPAIAFLWPSESVDRPADKLVRNIIETNSTFLSFGRMAHLSGDEEHFRERFAYLFESFVFDPQQIIYALKLFAGQLDGAYRARAAEQGVEMEKAPWFADFEALYSINIILRKLEQFFGQNEAVNELRLLFMLFQAVAREGKLVMAGEPLAGLQIMGMLETQNLDFKNVIVLSVNEDILPASKGSQSLIPFDVKAGFGIPVYKDKDAVYAYHFYRLLQRAENVTLIYNTQTQDIGTSEKSRYITQLQLEMPAWNPTVSIQEKVIALPPAVDDFEHEIVIPKTEDVMEKLWAVNQKGFSPSTLSHYIQCSLLFYFRHIAGIEEATELEETIHANTLGTVVHEVLQQLYSDFKLENTLLQPSYSDHMLKRVDKVIHKVFAERYKGGDISTGKNLLLVKVASRYVRNFLQYEKQQLLELQKQNRQLTYFRAEEYLSATLPVEINGQKVDIRFGGYADRVDKLDDTLRIIDYKSGKVLKEELRFKEWAEVVEKKGLQKSFQLLLYAFLYRQTHHLDKSPIPGIYSFRNISNGLFTLTHPTGKDVVDNEAEKEFKQVLASLMQDIFDKEKPFTRTREEENCKNCEFQVVCNRQ